MKKQKFAQLDEVTLTKFTYKASGGSLTRLQPEQINQPNRSTIRLNQAF